MSIETHPYLARAAGPLLPFLLDPQIREIRCTSAGRVFVLHSDEGKRREDDMDPRTLDGFLSLMADIVGAEWRETSPTLHAASPALGLRVQASRWPVSPGPSMTLRKHPARVYPLGDWVTKGILTPGQCTVLRTALGQGQTIAISGAIGSSKTSLLNALLHELRDTDERLIVIEDDPEIVCEVEDCEFKRTVRGLEGQATVTMQALCQDVLRDSPDRIIIGELRGAEALPAIQALATGHPGLFTVHARTADATLLRLEQLIQIASVDPQRALIAEAVNVIVHMEQRAHLWRCTGMLAVERDLDPSGHYHTRSRMES